ncbi:MAG: FHA domain-containing protein [Bacteroidales bacterium]|nr:FHA domain-containing protein [Bacteroidales bacterium]
MKTITIGRLGCDIILPDKSISRKHAAISLVDGQYVYHDMSKNGTSVNGRIYHNEKIVLAPGTPVYLADKIPLPWPQVLMLLPNTGIRVSSQEAGGGETVVDQHVGPAEDTIGIGWAIVSFLFPVVGFILYFVWKDTERHKAGQASNIAWISIAIGFFGGLLANI